MEKCSLGRPMGKPQMQYKGACKQELNALDINTCATVTKDRCTWRKEIQSRPAF
uniref:Uncharacterized protein n=1 Tax=Arion vulgaris TaxID=1028688 RepID=A0A0B7A1L9_9EUPU